MMLCLAAAVYIVSRAIPRIDDEAMASESKSDLWWERTMKRIPLDKIDDSFDNFVQKTLRKVKIMLMKADNLVTGKLKGFKTENGKKNGDNGIKV